MITPRASQIGMPEVAVLLGATETTALNSKDEEAGAARPPRTLERYARSINIFRLFAVCHIFVHHVSMSTGACGRDDEYILDSVHQESDPTFFAAFWVPMFYALSGFGAAHAHLGREASYPPEQGQSLWEYLPSGSRLLRRLAGVYPMYIGSLTLMAVLVSIVPAVEAPNFNSSLIVDGIVQVHPASAAAISAITPTAVTDGPPGPGFGYFWVVLTPQGFALELLLLLSNLKTVLLIYLGLSHKNELPTVVKGLHNLNGPDYYVQCLAVLWLFESAFIQVATWVVRALPRGRGLLALASSIVVYMLAMPFMSGALIRLLMNPDSVTHEEFYIDNFYHYFHSYFAGIVTAFWLYERASAGKPPLPYAATISFCLLLLVAFGLPWLAPDDVRSSRWWNRLNRGVSPWLVLFCPLFLGLAEAADPLARLASWRWLADLGEHVTLGAYLLQYPVILAWTMLTRRAFGTPKLRDLAALGVNRAPFAWWEWPACFALLLGVAMLFQMVVHAPLSRLMLRLIERKTKSIVSDADGF